MPENPLIHVRRARPADAAAFVRMMGEPGVYANLMQLPMPSEELWRKRLETMAEPDRTDLQLVAELDGRMVGSAGLHPAPQLRRRHVAMMGISVAAEFQGQGVGSALMQALCSYADGWGQTAAHRAHGVHRQHTRHRAVPALWFPP